MLVDGPAAIRYMAPSTREPKTIATPNVPVTWKKHPATLDAEGKTLLHPCLEVEVDSMASRAARSVAGLLKRYLGSVVGDLAVLIDKPDLQEEEEPNSRLP